MQNTTIISGRPCFYEGFSKLAKEKGRNILIVDENFNFGLCEHYASAISGRIAGIIGVAFPEIFLNDAVRHAVACVTVDKTVYSKIVGKGNSIDWVIIDLVTEEIEIQTRDHDGPPLRFECAVSESHRTGCCLLVSE